MSGEATRDLLVLRHAKSDREAPARSDRERPLAKRGRKEARKVGEWLLAERLVPDGVLLSPARRTEETLELVLEGLGHPALEVHRDERLYEAGLADLLAVLGASPPAPRRVLLVGHNPGLEVLVEHLLPSRPPRAADGKLLTTSALAHLRLPADWTALAAGTGRLVRLVRPEDREG